MKNYAFVRLDNTVIRTRNSSKAADFSFSLSCLIPVGSVSDPNPDPHWIRIANADPDPEGGKSAPKKKKN
jgi:hypothetical protein